MLFVKTIEGYRWLVRAQVLLPTFRDSSTNLSGYQAVFYASNVGVVISLGIKSILGKL